MLLSPFVEILALVPEGPTPLKHTADDSGISNEWQTSGRFGYRLAIGFIAQILHPQPEELGWIISQQPLG
jgi:hypothetical protein